MRRRSVPLDYHLALLPFNEFVEPVMTTMELICKYRV